MSRQRHSSTYSGLLEVRHARSPGYGATLAIKVLQTGRCTLGEHHVHHARHGFLDAEGRRPVAGTRSCSASITRMGPSALVTITRMKLLRRHVADMHVLVVRGGPGIHEQHL